MSELEGGLGKKGSISGQEPVTTSASNATSNGVTLQRMMSTTSDADGDAAYTTQTSTGAYESHEAEQVR